MFRFDPLLGMKVRLPEISRHNALEESTSIFLIQTIVLCENLLQESSCMDEAMFKCNALQSQLKAWFISIVLSCGHLLSSIL